MWLGSSNTSATCLESKPLTHTEPIPSSHASIIICVHTMLASISPVSYPRSAALLQTFLLSAHTSNTTGAS